MPLSDLVRRKITRPKEHWKDRRPHVVPGERSRVACALLITGLSIGLMIWGDGRWLTLAGLLLYLISLAIFLWAGWVSTDEQNHRLRDDGLVGKVVGLGDENLFQDSSGDRPHP